MVKRIRGMSLCLRVVRVCFDTEAGLRVLFMKSPLRVMESIPVFDIRDEMRGLL